MVNNKYISELSTQFPRTRSALNRASDNIRKKEKLEIEDVKILNEWRYSHIPVLNNFRGILERRKKKFSKKDGDIMVVQRLKRLPTIVYKIRDRNSSEPPRASRMQDIAGCRVIFENETLLYKFLNDLKRSKTPNKLISINDMKKNPKDNGYRGIHVVYEYVKSDCSKRQKVEIQLRTKYQNYWATAVEIIDHIKNTSIKYSTGKESDLNVQFFEYASEIISRVYESKKSCLLHKTDEEIIRGFKIIEDKVKLLKTLKGLKVAMAMKEYHNDNKRYVLLKLSKKYGLELDTSNNLQDITKSYFDEESNLLDDNIVGVYGVDNKTIIESYKNYFLDGRDFVKCISDGLVRLDGREPEKYGFYEKLVNALSLKGH